MTQVLIENLGETCIRSIVIVDWFMEIRFKKIFEVFDASIFSAVKESRGEKFREDTWEIEKFESINCNVFSLAPLLFIYSYIQLALHVGILHPELFIFVQFSVEFVYCFYGENGVFDISVSYNMNGWIYYF